MRALIVLSNTAAENSSNSRLGKPEHTSSARARGRFFVVECDVGFGRFWPLELSSSCRWPTFFLIVEFQ